MLLQMRKDGMANTPLRSGDHAERLPPPAALVIFGATGDLAHRKLLPALYNLALDGLLPPAFAIVGVGRRQQSDDAFRAQTRESIAAYSRRPLDDSRWPRFAELIRYCPMSFDDADSYSTLARFLAETDRERGTQGNRVYYLAVPPSLFPVIVERLGEAGLARENGRFARIIVEKPFGHDLASASALNQTILRFFREHQVYRIDHYLGKETVQNILVLRFGNGILEPIWNRRYIDHCQITVAETVGIGSRASYYEEAGALRDMVATHMMQLVALVGMEPPVDLDADSVRDEKVKLLRAIEPIGPAQFRAVVRGQYTAGWPGGQAVPGYREEPGVAPDSATETYVALRLTIDNWRWAGVPFYLRHGKRLPKRVTEIAIQFKRPPRQFFRTPGEEPAPNVLALRIQPNEGMSLRFVAKQPGPALRLQNVAMDFLYRASFDIDPPEAYERLIYDCLLGDSTLFARRDEIEMMWRIYDAVLARQHDDPALAVHPYPAGKWGPAAADALIAADGRAWRRL
ncbi:MAG: glucose-6-phosphate dehydrogenase [Chloroflexota bacterium]|nr:glucose-6-phosphate dehydrogenase [Dehalococcoidia bacterium]MDW8255298.1 glucose-6-phosphate dehydrogenase [Chloroflexota bacterium]